MHTQIKILYEEGYSMCQIARLQVMQRTVSRSIFNYKKSGKYGFKKPTGCPKITNKCMDDSIILAENITEKVIQAGLPKCTVVHTGDFLMQIESHLHLQRSPNSQPRTLSTAWLFVKNTKDGPQNNGEVSCFQMKHWYRSFMPSADM